MSVTCLCAEASVTIAVELRPPFDSHQVSLVRGLSQVQLLHVLRHSCARSDALVLKKSFETMSLWLFYLSLACYSLY